ncbi:hypothetical protein B0H19DRAFT_1118669 [Mycena capillaripes]|nr:hypothetical protein B0H19DRAFT_1118669 [Mycena capillaripes]
MQSTLPWPVSPEFEDALALATQRHLAQPATAPSTPKHIACPPLQHQSLETPPSNPESSDHLCSPEPGSVPRSSSLMMKTRVAVRDKTPHRFQVVPLRDAARNREKSNSKPTDNAKQQPAPWTRQLALLRPSGIGLGLNVPIQRAAIPDTPERGRERSPRQTDIFGGTPVARRDILRGLQGSSPKRPPGSPDRKENRVPASQVSTKSPTKRGRRRREYTLDPSLETSIFASEPTPTTTTTRRVEEPIAQTTQENTTTNTHCPVTTLPATPSYEACDEKGDITITEKTVSVGADAASANGARGARTALSRHFKSPSLGTIHHLLSAPTSVADVADHTPRVHCRKRTNTLSAAHASTKRYGVYTPGKLDFSPVEPEEDARIHSTYSLGALLSAYSYDSLPSLYSQDSFVGDHGTRPLRVKVRSLQRQPARGEAHPIVLQLIRDIDAAIEEWL